MVWLWMRAFALTVIVETAIVAVLFRAAEPSLVRRVGFGFFANLASHPAVWFVFPFVGAALKMTYASTIFVSEAWAIGSEVVFYALAFRAAPFRRVVGVTMIANGVTWGLGVLVHRFSSWLG